MKSIKLAVTALYAAAVVLAAEGSAAGVKWTVPASWKT